MGGEGIAAFGVCPSNSERHGKEGAHHQVMQVVKENTNRFPKNSRINKGTPGGKTPTEEEGGYRDGITHGW